MQTTIIFSLLASALTGLASASGPPNVYIDAYRFDQDLNTTLTLNLGEIFTGDEGLAQVSTLYLTGLSNAEISIDTIICTPYRDAAASSKLHGLPFYADHPSFLSTNEVVVGSIYCSSTALSYVLHA